MNQHETALTAEIRELVETMYGGYLTGDRAAIDALLAPNLTMFDSASPDLIDGMDELNRVRAGARASTARMRRRRSRPRLFPIDSPPASLAAWSSRHGGSVSMRKTCRVKRFHPRSCAIRPCSPEAATASCGCSTFMRMWCSSSALRSSASFLGRAWRLMARVSFSGSNEPGHAVGSCRLDA